MITLSSDVSSKISVVMSVYNGMDYLKESVESILNQSYKNLEFIIINDGSTDQTKEVLDRFAKVDKRVRVFHQKNIGLTKSLNLGISRAKGSYIARQDADDVSLPQRLEKQLHFLQENPKYFLVATSYREIDENSRDLGIPKVPLLENDELLKRNIVNFNPFCHPSVLFKNSTEGIGFFYDESFQYAQDYELWARILKNHKAYILPEVHVLKRCLPTMISISKERTQRWHAVRAKIRSLKLVQNYYHFCCYLLKDFIVIMYPKKVISYLRNHM
jgi:glycosyltransferase involved in cell wall biosynthesis